MSTLTTIQIGKETRQLLQEFARKDMTYDELLRELVAIAKDCTKKESLSGIGLSTLTRHDPESQMEGIR
jgi:hypothetical protein